MDVRSEQQEVRKHRQKSNESGFTLLEVTIAVVILSMSLITLLGLEGSVVQQTVRDRQRQEALLVGRRILAALEVSEEPPVPGTQTMRAGELLKSLLNVEEDKRRDPSLDMPVTMKVDFWKLPGVENPEAVKKVVLTIEFGPSELDTLDVVYFMPEQESDADTESEGGG